MFYCLYSKSHPKKSWGCHFDAFDYVSERKKQIWRTIVCVVNPVHYISIGCISLISANKDMTIPGVLATQWLHLLNYVFGSLAKWSNQMKPGTDWLEVEQIWVNSSNNMPEGESICNPQQNRSCDYKHLSETEFRRQKSDMTAGRTQE